MVRLDIEKHKKGFRAAVVFYGKNPESLDISTFQPFQLSAFVINTTVSTCLGAAGQIKRLVFDPLSHPNEGMGNSPVPVRVETVG